MIPSIDEQAQRLFHEIAEQAHHGFGTMSPAVYDTAWVAMVDKQENGTKTVLFPECFDFLRKTQCVDGTWTSSTSDIDIIINTLAALLALKRQIRRDARQKDNNSERCKRAEIALRTLLAEWNIENSDRVGFEILIPNLLKLLELEGVFFEFPCRTTLMALGEAKLAKLRPVLAGPYATTLVHSLEAFTGSLDFHELRHHKMAGGSMFGSPSSTAAYLMNSSVWDEEAETYLRSVPISQTSDNHPHGGFPSAFPSTIFETVWVTATLLDSGFTTQNFLPEQTDAVKNLLRETLVNQGGVVGFAPGFLADADDTAKSISVLGKLGYHASIEPMLIRFEAQSCFSTYHEERNPSISANCNVLICLLQTSHPSTYAAQIRKCANHIIETSITGNMQDKWNISAQYPQMLIAQAIILLIDRIGTGQLLWRSVRSALLDCYLSPVLLEILTRTMQSQEKDGSWESKHEVTAYAIITLSWLLRIPLPASTRSIVISAFERGKAYLFQNRQRWQRGDYLWIEKVAYASPNLSLAYCLAAYTSVVPEPLSSCKFTAPLEQSSNTITKFSQFFSKMPLFQKLSPWELQLTLTQSFSFLPSLKAIEHAIFPPTRKTEDEKYLQYIPFTWTGCRNLRNVPIHMDHIWEMMRISMLNFQVDAYIENVIGVKYKSNLQEIKTSISELCERYGEVRQEPAKRQGEGQATYQAQNPVIQNRNGKRRIIEREPTPESPEEVTLVLSTFISHILQHPSIQNAHVSLRRWLQYELKTFLHAHITHISDCVGLSLPEGMSSSRTIQAPPSTYYNWVRGTGADHTSCPYSFVFYLCLCVPVGENPIASAHQRFLLEDACHSLATLCRQYNDFGSVARDRQEENLNSINFPEFDITNGIGNVEQTEQIERTEKIRKQELLAIAKYKRRNLDSTMQDLEEFLDLDLMRKLRMFVDVTDLYGQIYVARDIGIRKVCSQ